MDLVLRTIVVYGFVFTITRLVGRREINTIEPFDLIMLVVVGDLIQQGVTQNDESVTGAVLVVSTLALLTVAISYVSFRFPRARDALEGEPVVVVLDGRPVLRNLKRQRISIDELLAEARLQNHTQLDQVRVAVLESDGRISFIAREDGSGGGEGDQAQEATQAE